MDERDMCWDCLTYPVKHTKRFVDSWRVINHGWICYSPLHFPWWKRVLNSFSSGILRKRFCFILSQARSFLKSNSCVCLYKNLQSSFYQRSANVLLLHVWIIMKCHSRYATQNNKIKEVVIMNLNHTAANWYCMILKQ